MSEECCIGVLTVSVHELYMFGSFKDKAGRTLAAWNAAATAARKSCDGCARPHRP